MDWASFATPLVVAAHTRLSLGLVLVTGYPSKVQYSRRQQQPRGRGMRSWSVPLFLLLLPELLVSRFVPPRLEVQACIKRPCIVIRSLWLRAWSPVHGRLTATSARSTLHREFSDEPPTGRQVFFQ
ncbi:hypothetical protein FA95DRAFT_1198112 [Auriscalpium vulgare]|uniref:Uncharacterized protein n=1 Tax=Auriscalpium vulgare TaxID=40419 RepID=A0ACB8RUV8_9AGAM|nr:hypothetical protein FA95DRAFT_1198112 [Auriscalpium vulgare]